MGCRFYVLYYKCMTLVWRASREANEGGTVSGGSTMMTRRQERISALELALIIGALLFFAWYVNNNMAQNPYQVTMSRAASQ